MQREIDIFHYFPVLMQEIKQFQGIRDGENPEFRTLFQSMEQVLNRAFIKESDEAGIRRWERILNLASNGDLDVRKFRVLARMGEQLPYTLPILKRQLELLCGSDGYTIALNHEEYTLQVRLVFLVSEKLAAVREYLERIKPANIAVGYGLFVPAIILLEPQKLVFRNFGIKASFWNGFGKNPIFLNGIRKLDGSWLLGQPPKETLWYQGDSIFLNGTQKLDDSWLLNQSPKEIWFYQGDSIFLNGTRKLDGSWLLSQPPKGIRFYRFGVKAHLSTCGNVSVFLEKQDSFCLDGSFSLDGSRTLSGGITKEDL